MSTKALPQLPARIPLPPYPNGWYSVCYSDELKSGDVKRVSVFGAEIALYRGEDGVAHALDAYCAHLGAHLAVGGKVVGNRLVCPFHAWEYGGTGKCEHIPYSSKIPPRAKQVVWPLRELNGYIVLWHHAEHKEPSFEVPEIPELSDPNFKLFKENTWEVATHLQEVFENAIDIPHFVVVHGMNVQRSHFETNGPFGALELDMKRDDEAAKAQVDEKNESFIRSFVWGPGLSLTRVSGFMKGVSVQTLTPIGPEKILIRHRYYVDDSAPKDKMEEFFDFYAEDWVRDFDIWNKKKYRAVPALADGDGDVGKFRRWYAQFYSEPVEAAAQ